MELFADGGAKVGAAIFERASAGLFSAALGETIAVAIHLKDTDVVGDTVQQRAS